MDKDTLRTILNGLENEIKEREKEAIYLKGYTDALVTYKTNVIAKIRGIEEQERSAATNV